MGAHLEKMGQAWRRVRPYLPGFLVVLVVAGAILALIYVPRMQVPVCPPGKEGLPPKICFDIENEARKTLAYILAGILAIIGIYMAHRRIRALERQVQIGQEQLQVAQEGQITERFTRAIEQLGSKSTSVRLGGFYAMERVANDSDKDYWPIIETLTAYVRERVPWREPPSEAPAEGVGEEKNSPAVAISPAPAATYKLPTDIQAVLTVLGRRKYRYGQGETLQLDLRRTDLRGAEFKEAHLEGAILIGAHMEGADFLLANLEGAFLPGAFLQGADLSLTNLNRAILVKAHLEGVDLSNAIGLAKDQLSEAFMDEETILPDYLQK